MLRRILIILVGVIFFFTAFILWSVEELLIQFPVRSEHFSASNKELSQLLRVPAKSVQFIWLSEPNSPGGITVRDSEEPHAVVLHSFTSHIGEKYFVHLYLDPSYQERIAQNRSRANLFINTHLLYSYLLTQQHSENLFSAFESFCSTGCNLENISVVK